MNDSISSEAKIILDRRERERRCHRVMTWAEYAAWAKGGGDFISSSMEANPFPGGLTIVNGQDYIGKVV